MRLCVCADNRPLRRFRDGDGNGGFRVMSSSDDDFSEMTTITITITVLGLQLRVLIVTIFSKLGDKSKFSSFLNRAGTRIQI